MEYDMDAAWNGTAVAPVTVKPEMLPFSKLTIDPTMQHRLKVDEDYINFLADQLRENPDAHPFPPIEVMRDDSGTLNIVWDGFQRIEAYRRAGRKDIPCRISRGNRREAFIKSLSANSTHGKQRSHEDIRSVVLKMLNDKELKRRPHRELARIAGVHWQTVINWAEKLASGGVEIRQFNPGESEIEGATARPAKSFKKPAHKVGELTSGQSLEKPFVCTDCGRSDKPPHWHCPECNNEWPAETVACTCKADRPFTPEQFDAAQQPSAAPSLAEQPEPGAKPKTKSIHDAKGRKVPANLAVVFGENMTAFRSLIQRLGKFKTEIDELAQTPGGAQLRRKLQVATKAFIDTQDNLAHLEPHVVCPTCDGTGADGCTDCKGQGWLSVGQYASLSGTKRKICEEAGGPR
jgi:hypothetical protein